LPKHKLTGEQMELLEKISKLAIELDWDVAFAGKSSGNHHLERVSKIAGHLLSEVGEKCGDRFVVLAGAWLHGVGLINGNWEHASRGKTVAGALLRSLGIEDATRVRIEHCVEAHDRGMEGKGVEAGTVEAQIVHDADTLDKIGPLGVLRHSWKMSLELTPAQLLTHLPKHLDERKENLYLDVSRRIAAPYEGALRDFFADEKAALRILDVISQCAKDGIPSEDVVKPLRRVASQQFLKVLKGQLQLKILETKQLG